MRERFPFSRARHQDKTRPTSLGDLGKACQLEGKVHKESFHYRSIQPRQTHLTFLTVSTCTSRITLPASLIVENREEQTVLVLFMYKYPNLVYNKRC